MTFEAELRVPVPATARVPPVTVTGPENVLAPVKVRLPALWLSAPEPEITPEKVCAAVLP